MKNENESSLTWDELKSIKRVKVTKEQLEKWEKEKFDNMRTYEVKLKK